MSMENSDKSSPRSADDERARALSVSKLYPQPTAGTRGHAFIRNESQHPLELIDKNNDTPINWLTIVWIGIVTASPFIIFVVGLSTLLATTTRTEAGQVGMLSTLYLLSVVLIAYMTYKYVMRKLESVSANPQFIYWLVVLFSTPTVVFIIPLLTSLLPGNFQSSWIVAVVLYLVSFAVFVVSTMIVISLLRRKEKHRTTN